MLRAREPRMLSAERAENMIDASAFEDAVRILTDLGYEDLSQMTAKEIDSFLNRRRDDVFAEISRMSPDREIVDLFRIKYDYHNVKVLIKAEAMNASSDGLFSEAGRMPSAELKRLYSEEKYGFLPGKLGTAAETAKSILSRTSNPQLADFELDRSYFSELKEIADRSENEFLAGYVKLLIDAANLKSAVRTKRMGKSSELLKEAWIPGGSVDSGDILSADDPEKLIRLFGSAGLGKAAELGVEAGNGGKLTGFELACDNAVTGYLKNAKRVTYGSEVVAGYLAAAENEITAVRMILTGKLAGVRGEVLKERLRELYA